MNTTFAIQPALPEDRPAIVSLLTAAGLPTQDLPTDLKHFLVVRERSNIVGSVGLELLDEVALLRSLAVSTSWRGTGLGIQLYRAAMAHAISLGVTTIYLITTSAGGFFEKQGFERIERSAAPSAVQGTSQFSGECPSSAMVMAKIVAP